MALTVCFWITLPVREPFLLSVNLTSVQVFILRIQPMPNYAKSQNGTYDNVPAGYWRLTEVNVGGFSVCMVNGSTSMTIHLRRILGTHLPGIFGSTQDSKPRVRYSRYGTPEESRKRRTFSGGVLNDTNFTNTVTKTVVKNQGEDYGIQLVDVTRHMGVKDKA
ncbi:hypothetical protein K505DRAFT_342591 [Melanomma pulvis-pyrius CBS 109.77]|uniref:Uncharacterized protein n=1 Tax=Melanomma pulvis-pyrius CBS 109.77 TaxID=1314802 RepID=A0A6A6WVA9_9PLEO|nr:hypothetical protein K505DRAFT_342591 [Melanomma pulvis-pyrius CBS 109.77]